jgi:hypothetical protein
MHLHLALEIMTGCERERKKNKPKTSNNAKYYKKSQIWRVHIQKQTKRHSAYLAISSHESHAMSRVDSVFAESAKFSSVNNKKTGETQQQRENLNKASQRQENHLLDHHFKYSSKLKTDL